MSLFKYVIGVYWKPYKIAKDKATHRTAVPGFEIVNDVYDVRWKSEHYLFGKVRFYHLFSYI